MSIKAIFYDFDGVIKESTNIKSKAFYDLYLPYGENIAQKVAQHHKQNGGVSRFEKFKHYHQKFLGKKLNEEGINEMANKFSDLVLKNVINCDYVIGAKENLIDLASKYQQFIISGTPQKEMEIICKELKITNLFTQICGSPKNKITWCKELIKQYNLQANEVVFIGDATTDYEAALHHKLYFVLRSHQENQALFANINVVKVKNLLILEEVIKNIN